VRHLIEVCQELSLEEVQDNFFWAAVLNPPQVPAQALLQGGSLQGL